MTQIICWLIVVIALLFLWAYVYFFYCFDIDLKDFEKGEHEEW